MSEFILRVIKSTPEYTDFGFNLVTFSFAITLVLALFLQLPGLCDQARKIWKNRSAEGISTSTFIIFLTFFLIFTIYNYSIMSGAGMLVGILLLPPQFLILAGVLKFNSFGWRDVITSFVAATLILLGAFLPNYLEEVFSAASLAVFVALWLQPLEMFKSKNVKNVSRTFTRNFLIVTIAWTIYGSVINNWYIAGSSAAFASAYGAMLILWYRFRETKI